ncbi:MAG: hypothetical protein JSV04_10450 [Candidatus Heimdallarchaeota archaeon]|nr:MAG: hypothetical protein JSV04_10450 [Candidatus Heimdallarchaeota archaeon]
MGTETDFSYLSYIPTYIFKQLIDKWNKTSIELKPNGLLSKENRETTIKHIQKLSTPRLKQLKKVSETLNFSDIWWQVYQISKIKPVSELQKKKKTFKIEKYFQEEGEIKAKGLFSVRELNEYVSFIAVEFSSRSTVYKRLFRFFYLPSVKTILLEPKDFAEEVLKSEILPFITKDPDKFEKKTIRARSIRVLTKKTDEAKTAFNLTHLNIRISLETSGIEGLSQIIIQGDDVIRGAETLEQRHEVSLGFMNSGPWVGAGTKDFALEVGKGLQIHQLENESLKSLVSVLGII